MPRTWACVQRLPDGLPARDIPDRPGPPGAGEQLVGPSAEQERVGALVGLVDERVGLVVALPQGPSAALESVPAVLIRRAAVSLHHSIDGDLSHGRQLHDRGSFTLAPPLVGGLTPATNTTAPIRHRLPDFLRGLSGTPIVSDPTTRQFRSDSAPLPQARPVRTNSATRSITKILTRRPHMPRPARYSEPLSRRRPTVSV